MLVGFGIFLVVAGAVLMWALDVNISFVDDNTLGLILFVVGILTVILGLFMNFQQSRSKHVEERRIDG